MVYEGGYLKRSLCYDRTLFYRKKVSAPSPWLSLEYNATPYLSKAESISTHESRRNPDAGQKDLKWQNPCVRTDGEGRKRIRKPPPAMLFINNAFIHWIIKRRRRIERAPARSLHKPPLYTETERSCLFYFYNLLLLFIKNKNATQSFQHSLCYALRGSIHSIIQYTRRREEGKTYTLIKGGKTLSKKETTRLLYVSALETSVGSNPSLPHSLLARFVGIE